VADRRQPDLDQRLQAEADAAEQRRVDAEAPEPRFCECGAELDPSLPRARWCEDCTARLSAEAPDDGRDTYDPADELCREIASPSRRDEDLHEQYLHPPHHNERNYR
jgi:hypothetical protein